VDHTSPKLNQSTRQRAESLGQAFMVEFLGRALERHPDNLDALAELGQAYTRLGRIEEGLEVDERLARLVPENPTVHYNLACSLAMLGQLDTALDALEKAVRLGYDDAGFLREDEDLASLRGESRFRELMRLLEAV
jgi:tetratricopeptide (TPR) repeat protein